MYGTLEAMKFIKEDHSLVFESIKEYEKGKKILKYSKYGVYPGSGIVNVYDNCTNLQPTLTKEFLELGWKLISGEIKEKIKKSEDYITEQIKDRNALYNIIEKDVQVYDIFEALELLKGNPNIEMEWIENKNYGKTRLRFEDERIVKDYNRTSYTPPELTDEFLSRYWKIGMKKVINLSGGNKDIVIIMEETKIHCKQNHVRNSIPQIDILEYGIALRDNFSDELKDVSPNKIEVIEDSSSNECNLYSNGELLFSLSPKTNWSRIGFTLTKEDAKGIIEFLNLNNKQKGVS